MSAIDCIDHVHIGYFNENIGVYWPLFKEKLSFITGDKKDDNIEASSNTLLFGGGSGEHPAMLFNNDAVVFHLFCKGFLFDDAEKEIDPNEKKEVSLFLDKIVKITDEYFSGDTESIAYWEFNQNHWPIETFVKLYKSFENIDLLNIRKNEHPYKFNFILKDIVGALIVNKMPLSAVKDEKLKELIVLFRNYREYLKPYMNNRYMEKISSFTPDYAPEVLFGRNLTIKGNNINTGYSLADWEESIKFN